MYVYAMVRGERESGFFSVGGEKIEMNLIVWVERIYIKRDMKKIGF